MMSSQNSKSLQSLVLGKGPNLEISIEIVHSKVEEKEITLITTKQYQQMFKKQLESPSSIEYKIYHTLNHYESQIEILRGQVYTLEEKINAINAQQELIQQNVTEPLDQNQLLYAKSTNFRENKEKFQELAELIDDKLETEIQERNIFFNILNQQFQADQEQIKSGLDLFERIINRKLIKPYYIGFKSITQEEVKHEQKYGKKNSLTNMFHLMVAKVKQNKEIAFRTLLKDFGLSTISQQHDTDLKLKGKVLMGLKEYPRYNKKHAFYLWYLRSTDSGESQLQRVADQLVLYTNINKTTGFYRLFKKFKGKKKVVSPKVKRMATMFYLYSRIFFERQKQQFFEKLKIVANQNTRAAEVGYRILQSAKMRKRQSLHAWMRKVKEQKKRKQDAVIGLCENLKSKMKYVIEYWRWVNKIESIRSHDCRKDNKQSCIKLLNELIKKRREYKIRQIIKGIEKLVRKENSEKANRFSIGLKRFVERTLNRALNAFKNELQLGQATKKRAVIQLINVTMGGQKRFYQRWLGMTQKTRLLNECKLVGNAFSIINLAIKSVSDNIFANNKENQIKETAILKIFANMNLGVGDAFRRWRQINTLQKIKRRMNDEQKKITLKLLNNLLNNGKTNKIRDVINKFRINRKIIDIQRNFLKRLLMSKAGLVLIAFKKFVSLPHRINKDKNEKANRFSIGLKRFVERTLNRALNAFKNELQLGQATKKRAVIQLINVTMGGQKRFYQRWLGMTQKTRLLNECKLVGNAFSIINLAIKSVSDNIFANNKENQIKETAILKIFANMNLGVGDAFRRWRQINTLQKIKRRMNDEQKKITLKLLNNLLNNGKTNKIRDVINKFRINRKIIDIQRNFLKRLLMSKAGLVLIAFKKFVSLPHRINKDKNEKANRFSIGLKRFVERTLNRALNAFKNELQLGQATKKRAVIQLINVTMGGQKRFYQRWLGMTQKTRLLNECKLVGNAFSIINLAIKSVSDNIFANNKENQIKETAILKIFANMNLGVGDAFRRWRQINTLQKIKRRMNDEQKKITLKLLNNLLNNGKTNKIRDVINKFRINRKIIDIQRNFLKRLLMSKAGLVLIAFKKFVSLPHRINKDKNEKANRFSIGLKRFVERTLNRALNAFKNELQLGQATKKRAVIQLINVTMGGQKRFYQRWLGMTQKTRLLNECKLVGNAFSIINLAIKSVSDNIFANNKENQIKETAILKIFANMNLGVGDAFRRWRQINTLQKIKRRMNDEQKKITLKLLNNLLNNGKTNKIRDVINKFRINRKIIDIQRNFLKRLLMSKAGLVLIAFKKFVSLPHRINKDKNEKANRFSIGLKRFVERTLNRALNAFKNELQLGQATKKRAVIQLINVTMGGQKRFYQRWLGMTQKTRLLNECKLVGNAFSIINLAIKSVSDNIFANNKENQIKETAILKIFANMNLGVGDAFRRWRQINTLQKIKRRMNDEQKKITLKLLNNLLNNGKTNKIRDVINKFRINRKIIDIQRNFLKRLLMSKAGLVLIAFKKFVSLPHRINKDKNEKANRFSIGLKRFVERTLNRALNAFKNELQLGQATKKRAVIQLINVTMGGQKRFYQRWLGMTQKTRLLNECKLVGNAFSIINLAIKSVSDNIFANNKENQIKETAILKIFANMNLGVGDAFRRWRQINTLQKIKRRMNDEQKKITLKLLNNLLNNGKTNKIRDVINKFRINRKIIDIQRNFLKRLLMSKAGLVLIAFKKFVSLPHRINKDKNEKANRFSIGLKRFVERTLNRALNAFKNELQLGQATKKRAVIQLINVTMGGQKRFYQRWLGMTQKTRLLNECKLVGNAFSIINLAIKSVSDNIFANNKENQIKETAILKIFANMNLGVGDAFRRWRQINTLQKIKRRMNDEQKKITLKLLNNLLNNGKTNKIRDVINKFRINRKIIDIQRNFLKRLLMSKAGLVLIAFKKFVSLPHRINKDKNEKANRFSIGLKRFVERTLNRALNAFKNELQLGQATKKRAVIQLINVTMGGQKRFYQRWLGMTQKTRLLNECKLVGNAFSIINLAIKSVSDNIFANNKENQIKETAILKIFANMNLGVGDAFRRWRQINTLQKIKRRMNDEQKKITLKLLNNLLNNGKTNKIRDVINKFRINRKIIDIQRNFLKRLLMSKAGLVLIAFKKFVSLPHRINKDKNEKANRFSIGLKRFVERTLNRALNAFKNELQLGQATKKRAVIQLINVTMGGQKRFYQRWLGMTQKTRLLNECKLVGNAFSIINLAIKSVSDNIFANNKENQIKETAILKIFANMNLGVGDAFRRWRQINTLQKIKRRMNDEQKKITLKLLNNLLNNGKTNKIRDVINKFRINRKIIDIQRNFLKRLLMSKAGLVLIAFKKFVSLPHRINKDKNEKANRFSIGLKRFVERTLNRALNAFKNELQLGQATKKRAVIQLINVTMGGQKRFYQRWLGMTQKTRLLNECKLVGNAFSIINLAIKSVSDNIFANNKENQIKETAILKIFANMNLGVGDAFRRWRQINTLQKIKRRMNDEQKKITLKLLNNLLNNGKTNKIRDVINKFRINRKIIDIQRNFLKRLLMSKAGLVLIAFKKFVSLPHRINKDKNEKANRFSIGLKRFVERTLNRALNAFKNELQLGQATKKRAVIQLINVTMGGQKRFYQRWLGMTQKTRLLNECKLVGNAFSIINLAIKSVSDNIFANNKENQIKETAILKIFANMNLGVGDAFRRWRQINTLQKIKRRMNDEQKKITLKLLNNLLNNGKTNKIRDVINKFRINRKIIDIQRNFLKRLLMSKAGLVLIAFKKFVSLPHRINKDKNEKANRFSIGLKRFVERTLNRALNAFKNELQLGQATKKRAVIQLINVTMGGQKRFYQRWLGMTQKTRLLNECKLVGNAFSIINLAIKSVSDNIFANNKENQIKETAILKIFANMNLGVGDAFRRWRQINTLQKIKRRMNDEQKKITLKLLNNLLNNGKTNKIRDVINKFRINRKIIDIQRNFLKRLLMSKAGLVLIAFKKFVSLPHRINKDKNEKANRFSIGLKRFVERTLNRALNAFKNELQLGQATKKRAVIQLINVTMGGQKRFYQRWLGMTQKTRLLNECKLVGNAFSIINLAIKSVSDNIFANNKENQIKETAILKIFANMNLGVGDAFRRWRQINTLQKIKRRMNDEQKKITLKLLNNLLNNGKTNKIRDVINKFRINRKIIDIQRNFLKRLLMSKAGLVLIAFKKFVSLPHRINKDKNEKANRFSIGLKRFVERTLNRALNAFKNELQLGQATKKRAVIQLINVTMGGQKRFYQRWLGMTQKTRLLNECKLVGNAFSIINLAIKSVSDNIFANNKENQIKETAILKIFANMNLGVGDAFRRWRQINSIQKHIVSISKSQHKVLDLLYRIRYNSKQRQRSVLNLWIQRAKKLKLKEKATIIFVDSIKSGMLSVLKHWLAIIRKQRQYENSGGRPQRIKYLQQLLQLKRKQRLIDAINRFKLYVTQEKEKEGDSERRKKGIKYQQGLKRFVQRTLNRALDAFKNQLDIGRASKKRAVIQLIHITKGGQKKYYDRWIESLRDHRVLKQSLYLHSLFKHSSTSLSKSYLPILKAGIKPSYTLQQIQRLQSYLIKVINIRQANSKKAFQILYLNYFKSKKNPWFKKAAQILALNTRVNTQKSFWRLKYNIHSTGVIYNAAIIVKLKKLFNNLRKYYELNMYKVFLTIDKYGRNLQEAEMVRIRQSRMTSNRRQSGVRMTQRFHAHHDSSSQQFLFINQQEQHITISQTQQTQVERILYTNRNQAIRAMDRIFKKNVKKRLNTWKKAVIQSNELQKLTSTIQRENYMSISRIGAADAIFKVIKSCMIKQQFKGFKKVQTLSIRQTTETAYDRSLDERLQLINRQNILMEQIRSYKYENEQLSVECENKEKCLRECNETVTLLSLRINYMITQKFVVILEKVYDAVEFRNVNDAFDFIIEEANANYERDELQDL